MNLLCPACGAEVAFKSRFSIFGVCSFCNSTLVRHDINLENFGKMADLPQDMSPLQIGTTGVFEKSKFEIIGRQKIGWESGSWNEWYLYFDNGKDGWLADAQGFYMMSFQYTDHLILPQLSSLNAGVPVTLNGQEFMVDDIREVTCIGSQGELPLRSVKGRKSTSVDLVGKNEKFANIDYSPECNRLFLGKYVDFDNFNFMNLRQIDGW
jgi:hypothetical protein